MSVNQIEIDLFVIGAMKSATTGLCDWLAEQPRIAMSDPKEPAIFASEESVRSWDSRVHELFAAAGDGDIRIDGSTDYTKFPSIPGVPERVHRHCPEARFVYMMRHPVRRAMSQYRFEWLLGGQRMPFERALGVNSQLIDNGRYAYQLEQWLDWFPQERFLLIFAEAFAADPAAQVARVLAFLGLPSADVVTPEHARSNESALLVRPSLARRLLRASAFGEAIRPLVPARIVTAYKHRLRSKSAAAISDSARRSLEEVFDADLTDLHRRIGGSRITCATWDQVATTSTPMLHSS